MNNNNFNMEDFINLKKQEVNNMDNNELPAMVFTKNLQITQALAKTNMIRAMLDALALPQLNAYKKVIDIHSYKDVLVWALDRAIESNTELDKDEIIQAAISLFLGSVVRGDYRYAFVDTEDIQVLDGKNVYNSVRDGDIELVKVILTSYPRLLSGRDKEIEKIAQRDSEVKEIFDKAMEEVEQ